jgi:acetyl esterase/lipase
MMRSPSFFFRLPAVLAGWLMLVSPGLAEPVKGAVKVVENVAYKTGETLSYYEQSRCHLDLYLPAQKTGVPALVWFHGGALTGGKKDDEFTKKIARRLAGDGIAVAAVNYRLSPKATYPAYLNDAAASFAWVKAHAAEYGIDPAKVFVGGHSAGGYLAAMVGLDERLLQPFGLTPEAIAGLIPISGQMMTHFTVRAERGILDQNVITADEAAPINHLHKKTPPLLIIYADKDWPARREENLYFVAALRAMGNPRVETLQVDERTHGSVAGKIAEAGDPAAQAIEKFIETISAKGAKP